MPFRPPLTWPAPPGMEIDPITGELVPTSSGGGFQPPTVTGMDTSVDTPPEYMGSPAPTPAPVTPPSGPEAQPQEFTPPVTGMDAGVDLPADQGAPPPTPAPTMGQRAIGLGLSGLSRALQGAEPLGMNLEQSARTQSPLYALGRLASEIPGETEQQAKQNVIGSFENMMLGMEGGIKGEGPIIPKPGVGPRLGENAAEFRARQAAEAQAAGEPALPTASVGGQEVTPGGLGTQPELLGLRTGANIAPAGGEPPVGGIPPTPQAEQPAPGQVEHLFTQGIRTEPGNPEALQAALQANGPNVHDVRPTAPALEAAKQRVLANPEEVYARILAKDPAQFRDSDIFDAQALTQHYGEQADVSLAAGDAAAAAAATERAVASAYKADKAGLALGRGVQAFSGWQQLSPERQLLYLNRMLREGEEAVGKERMQRSLEDAVAGVLQKRAGRQVTESKAKARQMAESAQAKLEEAAASERPGPPVETKTSKVQRSKLQEDIFFLENEARAPFAPDSAEVNIINRMKRLAQETGWNLPHDEAKALSEEIASYKGLPKGERVGAIRDLVQHLGEAYLPMLEERSAQFREAKKLTDNLSRTNYFAINEGRSPGSASSLTSPEAATLARFRNLAQRNSFLLPEKDASLINAQLDRIRAMQPGPEQVQLVKDTIRQMGDEWIPMLEAQDRTRLAKVAQLRQDAADLKVLSTKEGQEVQPRIISDVRKAVLEARADARKGDAQLPVPVAQHLLQLAALARDLPANSPERFLAVQNLMGIARNLIPATRLQQAAMVRNVFRVAITMWDFSAPFRQGRILGAGNPVIWAKAWVPMIKAFRSGDFAARIDAEIHTAPVMFRPGAEKLYLAPRGPASTLSHNEEQWLTRAAGSTTGWRRFLGAGASEDAYITFLNKLRVDVLANWVETLEKYGARTLTGQEIGDMASGINLMTGRGKLGPLERASGTLSQPLFAVRYLAATVERPIQQVQALASLIPGAQRAFPHAAVSQVAAQKIAATYGAYYAVGLTIMGLSSLAGAKVIRDARRTDFGDITWGPLKANVFADDAQFFTLMAREMPTDLLNGKWRATTVTSSGKTEDANRLDVLGRYLRYKLEPVFGFGLSALSGKNALGYPMYGPVPANSNLGNIEQATGWPITKALGNAGGYAAEATGAVPGVVSSFLDGYTLNGSYGGALGGGFAGGGAAFGLKTPAYQTRRDFQNEEAQRVYKRDYAELNKGQQGEIDRSKFVQEGQAQQPNTVDAQQLSRAANIFWRDRKAAVTETLAKQLDNPFSTPEQRRKDVQSYNDALFQAGATLFQNATVANSRTNPDPKFIEDQLAVRYWTAPLENPNTHEIDYKYRDAIRQSALDDAKKYGVDVKYVSGNGPGTYRGVLSENAKVRNALEQYVTDQETLKRYWNVRDEVVAKYPPAQLIQKLHDEAKAANDQQRVQLIEGTPEWTALTALVSGEHKRLLDQHPEIKAAGQRQGYPEFTDRIPTGLPRLPSLPSLPKVPALQLGPIQGATPTPAVTHWRQR